MNPRLQPLIQLQALDQRIGALKDQRRKIPDQLGAAQQTLREVQQRLEKATVSAESAVKARRDREGELETQEAHIQKLKARVSEIKKNVEYQAHLFEIQMAMKKKGEIEEQVLLHMDEVEQQQRVLQEARAMVAEAEATFSRKKADLEALDVRLAGELGEVEGQQREVIRTLAKDLLERYNKLKNTRKDPAVVPIRGTTCGGCRLQLPPQLISEVRRSHGVMACSFCERILYWEVEAGEHSPAPQESASPEGLPERA